MNRKEKKAATEARIAKEASELAENILKWAADYLNTKDKDCKNCIDKALKLAQIKLQKDAKANPQETHIYRSIASRTAEILNKVANEKGHIMTENFAKVKAIVEYYLGLQPNEVTLDTNFEDDLGADSLDMVDIVITIEEKFNIEIPDEETEKLKTVQDICNYLDTNKGE